jgi:hypothetical protein
MIEEAREREREGNKESYQNGAARGKHSGTAYSTELFPATERERER